MKSKKRKVYVMATLVAMAAFLPFQGRPWSLYVGACSGYSVLVFGLRRINEKRLASSVEDAKPASAVLLTHLTFLTIVVAWVWLCVSLMPHLPYFLRTEDTTHPYFGLAFLGILGLLGMEAIEQRWLAPVPGTDAPGAQRHSSR